MAVQVLGGERVNVQTQLASLASKPCHCLDVDKLMLDMTAARFASTRAFKRIHDMETALKKPISDGPSMKASSH